MANVDTAADFLKSIGIATSIGSYIDAYKNSSLIIDSLNYLGVSTVRAAYTQYNEAAPIITAVADAGIQFDFHVRAANYSNGAEGLASFIAGMKAFALAHPGAIVAIEGINEANLNAIAYKGLTGVEAAAEFQRDLYTAIKAEPALASISVYNLSIGYNDAGAYATAGDLSAYSDYANAHVYTATSVTSDKQFEWMMGLAQEAADGKPIVVTETGHTTLSSHDWTGSSDLAQAKMMLSELFFAFENGSSLTYLYELFDKPTVGEDVEKEGYFGLFNADGTPKIAATALHNLTTLLSFGDQGSADAVGAATYSLANAPADLHSMTLAKSGGVYDLVLWSDKVVWNDATDQDIVNPAVTVTVDLGSVQEKVYIYDPLTGTAPVAVFTNARYVTVAVSDHPVIIEVGASGPVTETVNVIEAHLSLSAAELVVSIGELAASTGLESVTLTDGHELNVSSVETMQYMLEKYGSVLSKIEGGFSFSISYGVADWSRVLQYDEGGHLLQRTVYGLADGVVTSKTVYQPDGSYEKWKYGITGQAWTSEHFTTDAAGKIVFFERTNAAGTRVYSDSMPGDSTRTVTYYSDTGVKTGLYEYAADGSSVATIYDAKGVVTKIVVKEADGDTSTTLYTNGVKTQEIVTSHLGSTDTKVYDAKGALLTDTLKQSDGSLVHYAYTSGVLTTKIAKHADGSSDTWKYAIKNQSWTTEHYTANAAGKTILLERINAAGTVIYTESTPGDGTKLVTYYSAAGVKTSVYDFAADGSSIATSYDAKGVITKVVVKEADGDTATALYTSGVKTQETTVSHLGSTDTKVYDAKGGLLTDTLKQTDGSLVHYAYTSGVLTTKIAKHADGSSDTWKYAITGQAWTTEHTTLNAAGKTVFFERTNAAGTVLYSDSYPADGTRVVTYYSTAGIKTAQYDYATDGSSTATTYDAKGVVSKVVVKEADGDTSTTLYASGVKTQETTISHLGSTDTKVYDAKGGLLTDTLKQTDGSLVHYAYTSGVLTTKIARHADGSSDTWKYAITGQAWTTEHTTLNAAGKTVFFERTNAAGTVLYSDSYPADGTRVVTYYSTAGIKTAQYDYATDGSSTATTYDAKGVVSKVVVKEADGDTSTALYANGVKTQETTVSHLGNTATKLYDAKGALLTDTLKQTDGAMVYASYTSGVLVTKAIKQADGSCETWKYAITGQAWTSEHYMTDAAGKTLFFERLNDAGTVLYSDCYPADGTRVVTYYSTAGIKTAQYDYATDGSSLATTYDAKGVVSKVVVNEADGDISTVLYASGVKTQETFVSHLGSTDTKIYDAKGALLTDTLKQADGSTVYHAYTASVLTTKIAKHVDGSSDTWKYGIAGQAWTTEHTTLSAAGKTVFFERMNDAGTVLYSDSYPADGTRVVTYYSDTGAKTAQYNYAVDGSKIVETVLQDGSGTARFASYDAGGTLLKFDFLATSGEHAVHAYSDHQTLSGGQGNDTFYFRTTADGTLDYAGGHDTVYNFDFSGASAEHLHLAGVYADDLSHAVLSQQGQDVLLTFSQNDTILFKNTSLSVVHWDGLV